MQNKTNKQIRIRNNITAIKSKLLQYKLKTYYTWKTAMSLAYLNNKISIVAEMQQLDEILIKIKNNNDKGKVNKIELTNSASEIYNHTPCLNKAEIKNDAVKGILNWDQSVKTSNLDKNTYCELLKYDSSLNIDEETPHRYNNMQFTSPMRDNVFPPIKKHAENIGNHHQAAI